MVTHQCDRCKANGPLTRYTYHIPVGWKAVELRCEGSSWEYLLCGSCLEKLGISQKKYDQSNASKLMDALYEIAAEVVDARINDG